MKILDHGYLKLVDHWGSDQAIIEAARMSTDKGFLGWGPKICPVYSASVSMVTGQSCDCGKCDGRGNIPGDEKLLRYLWKHKHHTPFEMAGMTLEVQAPIFVFREWHRHRTQSYNELSARYTPMPNLNYVPSVERLMMSGGANKQAQSVGETIDEAGAADFQQALIDHYEAADRLYRLSLGAAGVTKELARLCIPVGRYSRMRASANLRNWLAFITLRADTHAHWEIRQYAIALYELVHQTFPRTYQVYNESA